MARMEIRVEFNHHPLMRAIETASAVWSESKKDRFQAGWIDLEMHGAEMVDCTIVDGVIIAAPSDDFRQYCASWGIGA